MTAEWTEAMEKRPCDRNNTDIDMIYDQLRTIPAFQAMDHNLLRQICYFGYYEDLSENVTLFRQGDVGTNWYAVISGKLEAKTTLNNRISKEEDTLCTLGLGMVFGESVLDDRPRDATVVTAERCQLLRVEQKDFRILWEQNRGLLEEAIYNLNNEYAPKNENSTNLAIIKRQLSNDILRRPQRSPSSCTWNGRPVPRLNTSAWVQMQDVAIPYSALPITQEPSEDMLRCGQVLRTLLLSSAPYLIRDRKYHLKTFHRCMVGVEMVDWLLHLKGIVRTRIQGVMAWQALLEEGVISHVSHESHFKDKYLFYRFHNDVIYHIRRKERLIESLQPHQEEIVEAKENITYVLSLLLQRGPDALLRMILRKLPYERTAEDLETIYDELRHIKALSHLSTSIKKELAAVLAFEAHANKGTVLFHQGDEGRLWYIIVKGSVDVVIHGKGTVCSLYEGDDFGKLALVNDAPRAATIILTEDNCHFLSVDKDDFNRILRDVEANTVRLKEHGEDVLILQNVPISSAAINAGDKPHRHRYFVVAGTPQKILEHLLETCIDLNSEDVIDTSIEDFLFTHVLFMPYHQLCPEFMKFYLIESSNPTQDHDFVLNFKRKVIHFLHIWTFLICDAVFQDETFISLIEDLTKVVRADHLSYGHLQGALEMVMDVMTEYQGYQNATKEKTTWEILPNGHIVNAFDESGEAQLPTPRKPIRINDDCVFKVYCADHTYCTIKMPIRSQTEMIKLNAAEKMGLQEGVLLVEVKSNRDKIVFKDQDFSVQTSLSVNGRLFIIPKEHLDALTPLTEQDGLRHGTFSNIEDYSSKDLAAFITLLDWELFSCIHHYELLYHAFGKHKYNQLTCNLDVFLHRFNVLQHWPATEICLTRSLNKRTQVLKKFIKIAEHCFELQNLSAFLAIVMGLGNTAVIRLAQTWEKLPGKIKKLYSDFESLLDPSRNHRAYRLTVSKMNPPLIPLVPLLIKDLLFSHEGNKTYLDGLVNFEKMHLLAESLRTIRFAKSIAYQIDVDTKSKEHQDLRIYLKNLPVIDCQSTLEHLSRNLESRRN